MNIASRYLPSLSTLHIMTTFHSIDPQQLHFRECKSNASGSKTIFISQHPTSTDPAYNFTFQLSPDDSWHTGKYLTKAKFGIDRPMEDSRDPNKRALNLTAEDPALLPWLKQVEDVVVKMATARAEELWGKPMDEALVRDKLVSVYKEAPADKADLKPLVKTKIVLDDPSKYEKRNVTQFFVADNVQGPTPEYPSGKIDLIPVTDPLSIISRNSDCLAKIKVSSVWKSPIGFGITLMVSHLVVWPASATNSPQNAFSFGDASVTVCNGRVGVATMKQDDVDMY